MSVDEHVPFYLHCTVAAHRGQCFQTEKRVHHDSQKPCPHEVEKWTIDWRALRTSLAKIGHGCADCNQHV